MIKAINTAPIAVRSIMPAETSLAILAFLRHSSVTKSVIDSRDVFIISVLKPITIVKISMVISIGVILNSTPTIITNIESVK